MNENYNAHGAKVVEIYQNTKQGLIHLERIWREHFLKTMKPQYLPELWSVEHNVDRYFSLIYLSIFKYATTFVSPIPDCKYVRMRAESMSMT